MLKLIIAGPAASAPPIVPSNAETWRDNDGEVCAYGQVLGEEYWMHLPGCASYRFSPRATDVMAVVPSGVKHELVLDTYRRTVLPMALQVRGREVLHASAIRTSGGVLALCGISETGKSTIAFGLSRRGYRLWADDAVAVDIASRGVTSISLPFHIRLRPSAAELFHLDGKFAAMGASKDSALSESEAETAPLRSICVLRRAINTGSEVGAIPPVVMRRFGPNEALPAVLPHAYCFTLRDPERKRRMMGHYLELVAKVPIFDVCFQAGLANLPFVLDAIEHHTLADALTIA